MVVFPIGKEAEELFKGSEALQARQVAIGSEMPRLVLKEGDVGKEGAGEHA